MPEENLEEVAEKAVSRTQEILSAMVERIYDSQLKLGVWEMAGQWTAEEWNRFFAEAHVSLSAGYGADGEPKRQALVELAVALLGAARHVGEPGVGKEFVEVVIEQARDAGFVQSMASEVSDLPEEATEE